MTSSTSTCIVMSDYALVLDDSGSRSDCTSLPGTIGSCTTIVFTIRALYNLLYFQQLRLYITHNQVEQ